MLEVRIIVSTKWLVYTMSEDIDKREGQPDISLFSIFLLVIEEWQLHESGLVAMLDD